MIIHTINIMRNGKLEDKLYFLFGVLLIFLTPIFFVIYSYLPVTAERFEGNWDAYILIAVLASVILPCFGCLFVLVAIRALKQRAAKEGGDDRIGS